MRALGRRDVDRDHLGLGREGGAEAEPEVERDADHQRDVGAAQPGAARAGEGELVVGGHAAAAQAVEEHGDPQRLGQRAQCLLAVAPVQVGAGHDHRALGVAQQHCRPLERVAVGAGAPPRLGQRLVSGGGLGLHEHVVEREVQEGGARVGLDRLAHRALQQRRDLGRGPRGGGELDQRGHERDVVDLLQRALAPAEGGRAAAEDQHRRVVLVRGGDRAHPVGHPRPGGQRAHAERAGHLGPALGREGRGLLVADVDDVDALLAAAVVDREQVPAREREQLAHALGLERPGDQASTVKRGVGVGIGGHGRDANSARVSAAAAAR